MKSATMIGYQKDGKNWIEHYRSDDAAHVLGRLAGDLAAKYVGKAPYVRSVKRRNNYDGTQTYTVIYAHNGTSDYKIEYIVNIY